MSVEGVRAAIAALGTTAATDEMLAAASLATTVAGQEATPATRMDAATKLASLSQFVQLQHTDPDARSLAMKLQLAIGAASSNDRYSMSTALAFLDERLDGARRVWERVHDERLGLYVMAVSGSLFNSAPVDSRTEIALSVGRAMYDDVHTAAVVVRHELLGEVGSDPLEEIRNVLHLALVRLHARAMDLEPAVRVMLSEEVEKVPNLFFLKMNLWFDEGMTRVAKWFPRISSGLAFLFK